MNIERLKEIVSMAFFLDWFQPAGANSYPIMQGSEVEKCMVAMYDDVELDRMRKWVKEKKDSEQEDL